MSILNALVKLGFSNSLVTSCLFLLLLLALALFLHYKIYVYDDRFMELASKIPGPKWYPFIGSVFSFGRNPTETLKNLWDIHVAHKNGVWKLWMGPMLFVWLAKPKDVEVILSSNLLLEKSINYRLMEPICDGLLANSGEAWKRHRKAMRPGFSFQSLESCLKIFSAKSKLLTQVLKVQSERKQRIDIYPFISNCIYDILCGALLLKDTNTLIDNIGEEAYTPKICKKSLATLFYRMFRPWLYPDCLFYLTPRGREYRHNIDFGINYVKEVIDKGKEYIRSDRTGQRAQDPSSKHMFLNHVIENVLDKELSEDEVLQDILTHILAGVDTAASVLTFTMCILSRRYDVQEKLVEEILQVFGTLEEKEITSEDLQNLTYLGRVVKESMRLFSIIPFVGREATHEIKLPSGYTLPKGCAVFLPIFLIHRDPEIYPDPDVFDPDHFLPEREAARSPYAYIPFSGGLRNCIAKKFAFLEIQITLINVLRKFWITPIDAPLKVRGRIVLSPVKEVYIGLESRTRERPVIAGSEKLSSMLTTNISCLNVYFKDIYL